MNPDDVSSDDSVRDHFHDTQSDSEQVHEGHDLESGMLVRAREWIDLLPWLRLLRVLRVAGSPPLLMLTAIVLSIWFAGQHLILGSIGEQPETFAAETTPVVIPYGLEKVLPAMLINPQYTVPRRIAFAIWSIAIFAPLVLVLTRQGALLTVGRPMMSLGHVVSLAISRTPTSWLSVLVPFLCLLPFALAALLAGWVATLLPEFQPLQVFIGLTVAVIAVPCGLLTFGAHVAIPISWAALMNERDADALDSLSRGYEYLFRRPVQLVIYVLMCAALTTVIWFLATRVSFTASTFASGILGLVNAPSDSIVTANSVLNHLPDVAVLTLAFSLLGGVYLLLRYDAGNQEIEDLWEPPTVQRTALPELPKQQ